MFQRPRRYEQDRAREAPPRPLWLRRAESWRSRRFACEFRAIENERRRVAKDLHDEILPSLVRLIRSIQVQGDEERTRPLLDELHSTVAAFRDLLGELHPVELDEFGLVAALTNISSRYARLTGRFVGFIERAEECPLSELQQLCVFRALQCVLQMFSRSENDILIVTYDRIAASSVIAVRCVDKRVSSARWLSADQPEFAMFESWCTLANANAELGTSPALGFPRDLLLSVGALQAKEDQSSLLLNDSGTDDQSFFEAMAVAAERKRISAEIDNLIMPHLDRIIALSEQSNDDRLAMEIRQLIEVIATGVAGIMSELHRRLLAEAGLVCSIKSLVERFRQATGIEAALFTNISPTELNLSADCNLALYRVTQEALNNVEKHSLASRVLVSLQRTDRELVVSVEDNGRGINEKQDIQSRGLRIMSERAQAIGAQVTVDKSISFDSGTLVSINVPSPFPATD